ncbi:alpha/beta hydrolase-fold protein [Agrobacterium sp. a22-2]|uniref:alpha/beta hydrolase-fold protein n=1 Tax=Agrobacterium sp. a22-2 TaxID=2283840 RepID=UPI001FEE9364|nr:alpha/beta hydrolase-fold protein [Agrobacterium sp. a22-2]
MRKRGASVLVVLFSHSSKHHFKSIDFSADVLSIADKDDTYFTAVPDALMNFIKSVSASYDLVVAIGGSKGGHGAIYYGTLLARAIEKPVRVVAFSPVVVLSENANEVPYISYRQLMERARNSQKLAENLRRSTKVTTADPPDNLTVFCIVGAENHCDCVEAKRLVGAHILALPMYHHESVIPFLCDTSDSKAVTRTVLVLYDKAAEEADVAHLLQEGGIDKMIADLSRVPKQARLSELTDFVIKGDITSIRELVKTVNIETSG